MTTSFFMHNAQLVSRESDKKEVQNHHHGEYFLLLMESSPEKLIFLSSFWLIINLV